MSALLRFTGRQLAYWLLFFAFFRLWFALWGQSSWPQDGNGSVWASFVYALPLDLSMAAYMMVFPVLLWFIGIAFGASKFAFFEKILNGYGALVVAVAVLVFGANVFVYAEWGTPLNKRALQYLVDTPKVLLHSMSLGFQAMALVLSLGGISLFVFLYKKYVSHSVFPQKPTKKILLALPLALGMLVLGIRGTGKMPINESAVYHSKNLFCNHAATNSGWYLAHSLIEKNTDTNRYPTDRPEDVQALVPKLRRTFTDVSHAPWLRTDSIQRPNIVFILMESMTAQVIEELGGEKGVCPNIARLIQNGALFTNCYGSGYRTDQGLVSVLAGYPAQPDQSVIFHIEKGAKLTALPKYLKEKHGYNSIFVHGAELTFANFRVWLTNQRTDVIVGKEEFASADRRIRWGAEDNAILQRTLLEINKIQQPFVATALTVSLHAPFDSPVEQRWPGDVPRAQFLNHAAYADAAVGQFLERAAREPWYPNTLFVLVADHGASLPAGAGMDRPITRQVPLVFFGPALRNEWRGARIPVTCGHHDIPQTLLRAIDPTAPELFPWSRDLWGMDAFFKANPAASDQNFAYYTNENGLGWATPKGTAFYSFVDRSWLHFGDTLPENAQRAARAYLHLLYDDYLQL
jgi:phosphoglycerol transferase MdoB-like AlkP superfamily enzyme